MYVVSRWYRAPELLRDREVRELIAYKTSMITDSDPLRGLLLF